MKVCHITSAHPNLDKRIFYKECVSLAKAGFDTYIIAQGNTFEEQNVKIIGIPVVKKGRFERVINCTKNVYKKAIELNADIYHIHDAELLPYALKLKKRGKKVIFDSHEDCFVRIEDAYYIPKILKKPLSFLFSKYLSYICGKLDAIISVTPHVCEKYKKINENTFMVTNYPILYENDKFNYKKKLCTDKKIVFAGGIDASSMHYNIIKALEKCPEVTYVLCGFGNEKYINSLKVLPAWKQVNYVGKVPYDSVRSILENASVGVVFCPYGLSVGGNIGTIGNTKLFEYMIAGLPVICTDYILWKEIIEKNDCGICLNYNDIDKLSESINYLMNNPTIAFNMGQRARRMALEKYNWSTQEKILIDVYDFIINKNSGVNNQ